MNLLILFAFLAVPFATSAQTIHGSVGVVFLSDHKIVMAADSRMMLPDGPNDKACKIGRFDDKVIIVVAGPLGGLDAQQKPWLAILDAYLTYRADADDVAKGDMDKFVYDFRERIILRWQDAWARHPEQVRALWDKQDLHQSYIAGLDRNGKPVLFKTIVILKPELKGDAAIDFYGGRISSCNNGFCAIGQTEIVKEMTSLSTPRAIKEFGKWKPVTQLGIDNDIQRTERLVLLTMRYHRGNDVGGQIQSVELESGKPARWVHREPSICPDK